MADIQCPACGSHDLETSESSQSYSAPFGGTKVYRVRLNTCRTCGESGDFAGANGPIVKAAIEEADRQSIEKVLEWLNQAGITAAYLERALSLPARTAARWKAGGSSASGLALLRLVRAFPWLLEVAAAKFAEPIAKRAVIAAAASAIEEAASNSGFRYSLTANQPAEGTLEVRATFTRPGLPSQTMVIDSTGGTALSERAV